MRTRLRDSGFALITMAAAAMIGPGCEGSLEVNGNLDRVVGETVTLELVQGSKSYSGKVVLVGSDRTLYDNSKLKVSVKNAKKLTFVIPPDVAQGEAAARVGYADEYTPPTDGFFKPLQDAGQSVGGFNAYDVPLRINRLAMTMDSKGLLGILPLPPAPITPGNMAVGGGVSGWVSLSPDGGTLALLASDQMRLLSMSAKPKDISAPISQKGGTCLAALPSGMLVGTATQVIWLRHISGKGITRAKDFPLPGCQDISVSADGTTALVLSRFDSNSDTVADADGLTELTLGATPIAGSTLKVDGTPGALAVSLAGDGKSAVIADGPSVYGVTLKGSGQFAFTQLNWGFAAKPVSLASSYSPVMVSGQKVYVHAVAETTSNLVRFVAADKGKIKWVFQGDKAQVVNLSTQGAPTAIAFGRRLELYVAVGTAIYKVKDLRGTPSVISMGLQASNPITALVVQP